jgi:Rad3-related DNA helicase
MGKTVAYITAALALGLRVAVLTESKSLEDQLADDFGCIGLFDMRGLQNYTCRALAEGGEYEKMWSKKWGNPSCNIGPCTGGIRCDLKDAGCDYFDAYRMACTKQLVCTNYAYWIAIHRYGQGLGGFDLLVIDECHKTDSQLSSALSVELSKKDFKEMGSAAPKTKAIQMWRMWARHNLVKATGKLDFFTKGARIGAAVGGVASFVVDTDLPDATELKFWKDLEGKLKTLSEVTDEWVVDALEGGGVRIAPVWVRKYAESFIFRGIKRVVMMSATVRPKLAELCGIEEKDYDFFEYPSTFPVQNRPIYWIPTLRLNKDTTETQMRRWVEQIDAIIEARLDTKGIVHTVSYERQRYLLDHSRFREFMHANISGNIRDVVKSFRAASAPAILVSPSVGTGFDFPHEAARFQIIGKVPFRDPRGAVLQAQIKDDPDYLNYLTSQDLVQMYGRPNRAPDDFSETFIVDDSIEWFVDRYAGYHYSKKKGKFSMREARPTLENSFFPYYFLEAFERITEIPE